jgi:hypothetical protein
MSIQSPRRISKSGQKVSKGSTKPPGFTTPYYLYIYPLQTIPNTSRFSTIFVYAFDRALLYAGY